MKNIFTFLFLIVASASFAQNTNKVNLAKGQKITAVMTNSSDADMEMGLQMKMNTSSTNSIMVISGDDKNYKLSNTITKMNLSMSAMGQETNYDSEKPGDKDSEAGKEFSKTLNVPDTLSIERVTGSLVQTKEKKNLADADNSTGAGSLGGVMDAMNSNTANSTLQNAFFIIPAGKKTGDSWTDSLSEKNMRTVRTYTIKTIDKNIATILLSGTINGSAETEANGATLTTTMDTKQTGEIIVDINSGLVSKKTTELNTTGTIEIMGQSSPLTSKTTTTFTYQ